MVGVKINPISGLPSGFPVIYSTLFLNFLLFLKYKLWHSYIGVSVEQNLLEFVLEHVEDKNVEALLEVCEIFT